MGGLSVTGLVKVTISLTPGGAVALSFGVLLIAGDSNVINGAQRFKNYEDLPTVAGDFGTTAPEYLAASLYFGQTPQPSELTIGRWFSAASAAENLGAILNSTQQLLASWTAITNGGFVIHIDGVTKTLTGLDFSAQTNLNGVASVITTALSGSGTCVWNGSYFTIISATTGAGIQASGTVTFTGNPTASDTITINGVAITFVASGATDNQVNIGTGDGQTAANLLYFLNNSVNALLTVATYSLNGLVLTITYKTVGTTGNSFSLTKSSSAITLSAADLAGGAVPSSVGYATAGTGIDVSAQLGLTSALAQALVTGYAAEQPVDCLTALANASNEWYGSMFAATASITVNQHLACAAFINGIGLSRSYGVTITDTSVLSSLVTSDFASQTQALGYNQVVSQYSSSNPYAIASLFGRAFTVDYTQPNAVIVLMFKQEPGVVAETLTQSQASTLKAKNCNVFVNYVNNTSIIQYGKMASGVPFNTIQGVGWLQNALQTAVYDVLYQQGVVPQTDPGVNELVTAMSDVYGQGVTNGLIAPGIWRGNNFGQIVTGQFLKAGFYTYAEPVALQSYADRVTGASPPISSAVTLSGGILSADIGVGVTQ